MIQEKHVGVYNEFAEFENDYSNLKMPWVAYVSRENGGGYDVYYSNKITVTNNESLNVAEKLTKRIEKLEERIVMLTEAEYEELISLPPNGSILITDRETGKLKKIKYDPNVYYYTYTPESE